MGKWVKPSAFALMKKHFLKKGVKIRGYRGVESGFGMRPTRYLGASSHRPACGTQASYLPPRGQGRGPEVALGLTPSPDPDWQVLRAQQETPQHPGPRWGSSDPQVTSAPVREASSRTHARCPPPLASVAGPPPRAGPGTPHRQQALLVIPGHTSSGWPGALWFGVPDMG